MSATTVARIFTPGPNSAFILALGFCLLFHFGQHAIRSAPGVMLPELKTTFGLTTLGVSSLIGLYVAGAALVAGSAGDAEAGRLLQGAGTAFAFTGAVYLASHRFPAAYLAAAVRVYQMLRHDGAGAAAKQREIASLSDMRGMMSLQRNLDRSVHTRANDMRILEQYTAA